MKGQTADRRSEKNLSQTSSAKAGRAGYRDSKSKGKCVMCERADIWKRSYCYDCSLLQSARTYKSGARAFAQLAGIDWADPEVKTISAPAMAKLLEMLRSKGVPECLTN